MPTEGEIEIVTILGTTRPGNFTAKALALVVDELRQQTRVNVTEINPRGMHLLFPGEPGGY